MGQERYDSLLMRLVKVAENIAYVKGRLDSIEQSVKDITVRYEEKLKA